MKMLLLKVLELDFIQYKVRWFEDEICECFTKDDIRCLLFIKDLI